jgi:hypothetical protein
MAADGVPGPWRGTGGRRQRCRCPEALRNEQEVRRGPKRTRNGGAHRKRGKAMVAGPISTALMTSQRLEWTVVTGVRREPMLARVLDGDGVGRSFAAWRRR